MTPMDTILLVFAALVAVAAVLTLHRMIVGPTILDRAVAADMLTVLLVIGIGLYVAHTGVTWPISAMLALTALAFVSSVSVARFVAREDRIHTASSADEQPAEETTSHEVIHPDRGHAVDDEEPGTALAGGEERA